MEPTSIGFVGSIDIPKLRGALAERRIAHSQFARVCDLNPRYLSSLLCGKPAGELARYKIRRGMRLLGLSDETADRQARQ